MKRQRNKGKYGAGANANPSIVDSRFIAVNFELIIK